MSEMVLRRGVGLLGTIGFLISFYGCSTSPKITGTPLISPSQPPPIFTLSPTANPKPTETSKPTITLTAALPTSTPTPNFELCSPLEGIDISELPNILYNSFSPPRPGSDDPHQGVDFYDLEPDFQIALTGRSVQAVLDGSVAGVIQDRFPYGNAVIIETSLKGLPTQWLEALQIPTPDPNWENKSALTCPNVEGANGSDLYKRSEESEQSIYLLYAHMQNSGVTAIGEKIQCRQVIGAIGNSGNSLNPHLHLEIRGGPSGYQFESMAHYDASASPEEMANYCLWRVSGIFQLIDPMALLVTEP